MKTKEQGVLQVVLDQGVRITSLGVCLFILAFLPLFPSTMASGLHSLCSTYSQNEKDHLVFGSSLWFPSLVPSITYLHSLLPSWAHTQIYPDPLSLEKNVLSPIYRNNSFMAIEVQKA